MWAAGVGASIVVLPVLDLVGMGTIWYSLIRQLAKESGHKVGRLYVAKLVFSVTSAGALYLTGSSILSSIVAASGVGLAVIVPLNSVLNYLYTYRLGRMVADQFETPDFNPKMLFLSAGAILAIPSLGELTDAFETVGDAIGLDGDAVESLLESAEAVLET